MKSIRTTKKLRRRGRNTARGWLAQAVKTYMRALESTEPDLSRATLGEGLKSFIGQVLASCEKTPRCSAPVNEILDETTEWLVKELGMESNHEAQTALVHRRKRISDHHPTQGSAPAFQGLTPLNQLSGEPPLAEVPQLKVDGDGHLSADSVSRLRDFHPEVVLISPQIPPNTGTIARLCAALSCRLHLIEPIGFDVSEKSFRRAGLDYWQFVELYVHHSWEAFIALRPARRIVLVETGGQKSPSDFQFHPGDLLVFGAETFGIPQNILAQCIENQRGHLVTIPMFNRGVRSLNLANSVSIVTHCALASIHAHATDVMR